MLINPELCAGANASVIVAARGRCEVLSDSRSVLDDLGVTSGDLVQANGVIWVEGPSDRIYTKRWLELYSRSVSEPAFIELVHYAFVSYGGALLKHIGLTGNQTERVDIRTVNRNFSVVLDRDLVPSDGRISPDKQRMLDEAALLGSETAIWVTEGYTIESYLPTTWEKGRQHIKTQSSQRVTIEGIGKVDLARRFAGTPMHWDESFLKGSDLSARIQALHTRIRQWQSPQEVIVPPYLPPWLVEGQ